MTQPLVSIITVNFNGRELTLELLQSIFSNSYKNLEVIVVDNGSAADPSPTLRRHFPLAKVVRSRDNLGFAGGNNLGLQHATGNYIFFVNNDAELTDGVIESLLQLFHANPRLGAASPKLCYFNVLKGDIPDCIQYAGSTPVHPLTGRNRTIGYREADLGQYDQPRPTAYCHGAAMMVPRHVIEQVGPMAEDYFLYYEELDWCERIRSAGYEIWVDNRVRVYHKESITVNRLGSLKTYYLHRNRMLFMRRHRSMSALAVFFSFVAFVTLPKNAIIYLLRGQWSELRAFLRALWWNLTHGSQPAIPTTALHSNEERKLMPFQ
ncbi:MAG: glycosyl transferase [Saprospiraceae bacterium]|nr:MAG: glycosyl transferase [Saprospiraceae bacterium]